MKVGIAIDAWKREIFERHLTQAGYKYTVVGGPDDDVLAIQVMTDNADPLQGVVEAAQLEAAASKGAA